MNQMRIILFLFCINTAVFGQNLVKNPQFEDYYHLPDLIYEFGERYRDSAFICKYWHRPKDTTPDYFHVDAKHERYMIPYNMLGYHPVLTDSAYIGFVAFSLSGFTEPFAGEFIEPLKEGKNYKIRFLYRFANVASYYYLNKLEVLISHNIDWFEINKPLPDYRDLINPDIRANVIFSDIQNDGEWNEASLHFTAEGGERYIIFGFFYQNERLNKIIGEYVGNNFEIGHNLHKKPGFYRKHRKYLSIHPNPGFIPAGNDVRLEVSLSAPDTKTRHIITQRNAYYFIDDVSVTLVEDY